jgi:DNA-binding transcriptional LysR family regulator
MDLLALADFNLVARHGGFGRAARATGRPKATLSRRVSELETSLGLRLFERGTRVLKLTQEGHAFYERTRVLLTELDETASSIASDAGVPRGTLRVSVPLLFSQLLMGKLAAEFAQRYPQVRLEVTADDRAVDMIEEGYDLMIRVDPPPEQHLIGRIMFRDRLVLVASPALPRPAGDTAVPAVLRGVGGRPASHDAGEAAAVWEVSTPAGRSRVAIEPMLRLSSLIMVRDAVRAGIGVGRLPISLVRRDLQAGTLIHWGDIDGPPITLWALYPSRRLLSARVAAFLDHLKEAFPEGTSDEPAAYVTSRRRRETEARARLQGMDASQD